MSSLDDIKTSSQSENNAAKTIALDHLGVIAARIRSSTLKFKQTEAEGGQPRSGTSLKPMDEVDFYFYLIEDQIVYNICIKVLSTMNVKELDKLLSIHQDVATHLCKRSSEDQAFDVSPRQIF